MAVLAAKRYDPGTVVDASCAALLAMTAFDTTNLRLTFTAPANGIVLCHMRVPYGGAASAPTVLLGVLDGSTVRGRQSPLSGGELSQAAATHWKPLEASFLVTGLTSGTSYTFDAAYGVEFAVAGSVLRYGGPNDATANNSGGAFCFEIYDTKNLLYGQMYDPATAATRALASAIGMTIVDVTAVNLRAQFTTPASGAGSAFVLIRTCLPLQLGSALAPAPSVIAGVMNHTGGATVSRQMAVVSRTSNSGAAATDRGMAQVETIREVTPSTTYDWDLGYAVERTVTGGTTNVAYGGPNDTTQDNAWGGVNFEVWAI